MTRQEFLAYHLEKTRQMHETTKAKNSDYTGDGNDPFSNFTRAETMAGVTTEQGFMVRMSDKWSRLLSFMKQGFLQVKDESIEDTLIDLANYCILLAAYIKSKRG